MAKRRSTRARKGKAEVTQLPVSQPADVPLVAAAAEEVVPDWQPSIAGADTDATPTDRPLRVYADGEALSLVSGTVLLPAS